MTKSVIFSSYFEQIQTTFETMRRRSLIAYDTSVKYALLAQKCFIKFPNLIFNLPNNELFIKIFSDICQQNPLDAKNKTKRNSLEEFYFGICVLTIALCAGEMTGVLWSATILSSIFNSLIETLIIILLPIYGYLYLKRKPAYDAMESRSWLFGLVFLTSTLIGDLKGASIITTNPSLFFIVPFFFALMIDVEFLPNSFYSNRFRFLVLTVIISFLTMQSFATIFGMASYSSFFVFMLQCLITVIHFQIMEPRVNGDGYIRNEAQLLYISVLVFIQLIVVYFSSFN